MIHKASKNYNPNYEFSEAHIKRGLAIELISKMPMTELEKFIQFENKLSEYVGYEKITATIELIDV